MNHRSKSSCNQVNQPSNPPTAPNSKTRTKSSIDHYNLTHRQSNSHPTTIYCSYHTLCSSMHNRTAIEWTLYFFSSRRGNATNMIGTRCNESNIEATNSPHSSR
eukprot:789867_1